MKTLNRMKLKLCCPFFYLMLLALLADVEYAAGQGLPVSYNPLNSWSFYDTNGWASDDGYAPVSFTNITASLYGDGTALVVDGTNAAGIQYNVVEGDGTTNLTVNQGSLTLWFAPSWTSTNAGGSGLIESGQLIDAGQWTSNATYGWWSLNVDPAGANLYFSAQNNTGSGTNYLSAPISWTSNQWHFVALTYSVTNTALYLDGQLATTGAGMSIWPGSTALANGFFIGGDDYGLTQAHGTFDDIYTYNVVVDSGTISNTFSLFEPAYCLLDSWSFNDTNYWTSDFGFAPVSFTNLNVSTLGDGKYGSALIVDTNVPAWLQYNMVEANGRPNLTLNQGSVTLWFAPDWASYNAGGFGPGSLGELINVGQWTSGATYGWWSLNVDSAGDNLTFSAQDNAGDATNYLTVPIAWTTNRWHFIALTYSSNSTALYIDGNLATNGAGVSILPGTNVLSGGIYFGSDTNGNSQAHGIFDDIYTYSAPLNASLVGNVYDNEEFPFVVNPLNVLANAGILSALSSPTVIPTFNAVAGSGSLQVVFSSSGCGISTNVWMTNLVVTTSGSGTNATMNVQFTLEGGSNNVPYDIFANSVLSFGTNGIPWAWMGQAFQCNTYLLTNLPNTACFFIVGGPQDTDKDGLTDAYERLVSKTNPNVANTSGDGLLDGWDVLWGLNPLINNWSQSGERSNYTYDPVGEVQQVTGARSGSITDDAEGNVTGVSQ
jgi:hypothetical protein